MSSRASQSSTLRMSYSGDLSLVQNSKRPDRIVSRVQSIIEQHPDPGAPEDLGVMEALMRASKGGDQDATELLVFGDLGELIGCSTLSKC
jgi:hypothetical protein